MISYLNYEIKHNLIKNQKYNALNKLPNKDTIKGKKYVNELPANAISLTFFKNETDFGDEQHKTNNFLNLNVANLNIQHNIPIKQINQDNELKPYLGIPTKPNNLFGFNNSSVMFNLRSLSDFNEQETQFHKQVKPFSFNKWTKKNVLNKQDTTINVNDINNLKSKTMHIVYQYKYKNKSVTGFGDFVRSIYFTLQFCEKYKLSFEIDINKHAIKKWLSFFAFKNDLDDVIENAIPFFDKLNYEPLKTNNVIDYKYLNIDYELISQLNKLPSFDNDLYFYWINHPDKTKITESNKEFVKTIIKPTEELDKKINVFFQNLNLVKHNFITIHVRYFDEELKIFDSTFKKRMNYVIQFVNHLKDKMNTDFLLITSNNQIKNYLVLNIPYVKTHFNDICHTCDNSALDVQVINTLKDFFTMSYSTRIYSFSVYNHGSGFSEWCALTHNIPYICHNILL